ncbi:hypothetical protein THAOC_04246 [Thalassiosira oceanica]|uniref:Uncharacterized protein n=1 Tax=Thalassiosira oceanica TaxID=159749 RepID=K0T9A8_THAOC|nr:hypothetical protein THAOC_04246 [Thalassiosira oceanica]|eukprot:EJK74100.1 hypothetical protein THAOC_04246 [Thalassiosira oceanica]
MDPIGMRMGARTGSSREFSVNSPGDASRDARGCQRFCLVGASPPPPGLVRYIDRDEPWIFQCRCTSKAVGSDALSVGHFANLPVIPNPPTQPAFSARLSSSIACLHFFGTWRGTMPTIDGDGPPAPANELFDPTQLTQNELDAMDPAQSEGDRSSSTSDSDDDDDEDDDDDDDAVSEASSTRNARSHRKQATLDVLVEKIQNDPIEDPSDTEFIMKQKEMFSEQVLRELDRLCLDSEVPGRLTEKDRLRFIILFVESEEIVEAFKRSQHAMEGGPEGSLSRRGCDDRLPGWEELLVERFNDAEVQARTTVKPHLHAEFAVAINCPKGEYQLTVDKAKDFLQDQKHKIRPIVNNYNASGNGSDMMVMEDIDSDSEELHNFNDDEDEGDDRRRPRTECCEDNWGRFKAERAQKRAQRLLERVDSDDIERRTHLQELVMMNGDDRRSFLRGQPTSLLYIWDELDKHQLLFKVAAMLDGNTGSSSTKTPAPINRRGARGTKRSGRGRARLVEIISRLKTSY